MDTDLQNKLRVNSTFNCIPPEHTEFLGHLKDRGFEPKVIYDIGSSILHWVTQAKRVWPEARFICFDGTSEIEFLYAENNLEYYNVVLSNEVKNLRWYENQASPGGNSYYREQMGNYYPADRYQMRTTVTLDQLVAENSLPLPDFMKLDVQGCETDILLGAKNTLANCSALIVEMQHIHYNEGAPLVGQTLPFIESLGFKCTFPLFCGRPDGIDGDYFFERIGQ